MLTSEIRLHLRRLSYREGPLTFPYEEFEKKKIKNLSA